MIGLRRIFAWVISLSLLSASLLPYVVRQTAADPDGTCGPIFVLEHNIDHVEAPIAASRDHCVFCHLWHAMAGASISNPAVLAPPVPLAATLVVPRPNRVELPERSTALLRGPPSTL